MKNVGNSSRGRSQGVQKIFRAPMYRAHCAVIFVIAQLSCCALLLLHLESSSNESEELYTMSLSLVFVKSGLTDL